MTHRTTWIAVPALLYAMGCGGSDREADLAAAAQSLDEARASYEQAREDVAEREAEVDEANQRLAAARTALGEAESLLRERQARVSENATDDVLFRAVQSRLLEDEALEDVAIRAAVSDGVVTLSGSVADGRLRDRAVEVAQETPGVVRVESRVEVQVSAPPATAEQ